MGLLVDGQWQDKWYDTQSTGGKFVRKDSSFREWVKADGSTKFLPEHNRYHLYVSLACPWAHRALIMRALKGLENCISVSVVDAFMGENGWSFTDEEDPLFNAEFLHQIYTRADKHYTGRVTVPVLWDKKENTIVNNESSEIIRMLNTEFSEFASSQQDYYPEHLRNDIDEINDYIYDNINNGVYKCGFATEQSAYEGAYAALFKALDTVEARLEKQQYLLGDDLTEADWRLFTTLARFDAVYVGHFKCNKKRIADYPQLSRYLQALYRQPGVADTVNMQHIKHHYYVSHVTINPTGIVPVGPELEFML